MPFCDLMRTAKALEKSKESKFSHVGKKSGGKEKLSFGTDDAEERPGCLKELREWSVTEDADSDKASEKLDEASTSSGWFNHYESTIKELENQNLIEITNPVWRSNAKIKDEKDENIAFAEKEMTTETVDKESGDEKLMWYVNDMTLQLEAQRKMIQALLAAHEVKAEPPSFWDHSATSASTCQDWEHISRLLQAQ